MELNYRYILSRTDILRLSLFASLSQNHFLVADCWSKLDPRSDEHGQAPAEGTTLRGPSGSLLETWHLPPFPAYHHLPGQNPSGCRRCVENVDRAHLESHPLISHGRSTNLPMISQEKKPWRMATMGHQNFRVTHGFSPRPPGAATVSNLTTQTQPGWWCQLG